MKKVLLTLAVAACTLSAAAEGYNRAGLSFNNVHYASYAGNGSNYSDLGRSMNGFGLDYIHGFGLTDNVPLFLEVGGSINFNFGTLKYEKDEDYGDWYQFQENWKDINLTIPVNIAYRLTVNDDLSITPYFGINAKIHFATTYKNKLAYGGSGAWKEDIKDYAKEFNALQENINVYSADEDNMGSADYTWNRVQLGWQIGIGVQYKPIYLGVQYGTDFIPAYSHKFNEEGYSVTPRVSTANFRINLAYCF